MNQGDGHEVTTAGTAREVRRWHRWRRRRRPGGSRIRHAVGVLGGVLCLLSFLMLVAAGLWWLGARVWDAVPDGAGVLAAVAFGGCLVGGTLASAGGETDG